MNSSGSSENGPEGVPAGVLRGVSEESQESRDGGKVPSSMDRVIRFKAAQGRN